MVPRAFIAGKNKRIEGMEFMLVEIKKKSVYLASSNGAYKIGISAHPEKRIAALRCGYPDMKLIFESDRISNAYYIENLLHRHYSSYSIGGEWFVLTNIENVIKKIKECVAQYGDFSDTVKNIDTSYFNKVFFENRTCESEKIKAETQRMRDENEDIIGFIHSLNGGYESNNYTKLIYKTIFGKTMKELQEQYKVKGKESVREYVTADELKQIESMEMLVSSLISCGWGYDQIKSFIQENSVKMLAG